MVNLRRLKNVADKAKQQVEKRGGSEALKEDADELKGIAKGEGSLKEKAKAAGKAIKEPGKRTEQAAEGTEQLGEGEERPAP